MFFLLPGAERNRKKLLTVLAVLLLCVQSCFPLPLIDNVVNTICGPVMQPVTRLAGVWSSLFQRLPAGDDISGLYNSPLITAERKFGHPIDVPSVVWLEVPVLAIDFDSGVMKLGAGNDFHLSPGQVVAFADNYLGRIADVDDEIAFVDLFNRAGHRTGVTMGSAANATQAVCFGRGLAGTPVIDWFENEKQAHSNMRLTWRPRPLDPEQLAQAKLMLGVSAAEGSSERGDGMLVVEHRLPASAEGRVYVAASAVGENIVSEPLLHHSSAQRILLGDGVFNNKLCAISSSAAFYPAVLSDHARVCGEVVAWRGNWGWAYLQAPSSWWQQAVTIEDGKVQLCDEQQAHYDQVIYTRGGSGVPRGMLLGTFGDRSFVPSANLDVWLAPQSTGDLRQ